MACVSQSGISSVETLEITRTRPGSTDRDPNSLKSNHGPSNTTRTCDHHRMGFSVMASLRPVAISLIVSVNSQPGRSVHIGALLGQFPRTPDSAHTHTLAPSFPYGRSIPQHNIGRLLRPIAAGQPPTQPASPLARSSPTLSTYSIRFAAASPTAGLGGSAVVLLSRENESLVECHVVVGLVQHSYSRSFLASRSYGRDC